MFDQLGETNDFYSLIPSRMKLVSTLDVKADGSVKVEKRTLTITSCEVSSYSKGKVEDKEQVSYNHITIRETDNLVAKV